MVSLVDLLRLRTVRLGLVLGLSDFALLGDEAVLDHLINVLFLSISSLVVKVHVAHLLRYVRRMHTRLVAWLESVGYQARVNHRGARA